MLEMREGEMRKRRAPHPVDGSLVRVAVRTSENGVHGGKSIGGGDVEPAWRFLDTRSRSITTPRPPSGFCHHSSSHWIQHDLAAEFLEGTLLFHEQTFEPALQQVSQALMATIEPLGVGAMESAYAATKIRLGRFNHQVIVISHQTVHGAAPVLLLPLATEYTDELVPIAVLQEDGLLCIAASGDDVVESTGKFEAEWASHETRPYRAGSAKSKTDPASQLRPHRTT